MTNHRSDLPNDGSTNTDVPFHDTYTSSDTSRTDTLRTDVPVTSDPPVTPTRSPLYIVFRIVALMVVITGIVFAILSIWDPMGTRSGVVPADETYGATSIDPDQRVVEYDGSFDIGDYVKKHELVVLELKTSWCGYCKEFESRLGDILDMDSRVRVVLVDVEKYKEFGKRFDVMGTPTFVRYVSGEKRDVRMGSQGTEEFVRWINE